MSKTTSIGIDVGGTKTLFALFDKDFKLLDEIKHHTPGDDRAKFSSMLNESVEALLKKARKLETPVSAIGVGFAGTVDMKKGLIKSAPNLPALDGFPFLAELGKLSDVH